MAPWYTHGGTRDSNVIFKRIIDVADLSAVMGRVGVGSTSWRWLRVSVDKQDLLLKMMILTMGCVLCQYTVVYKHYINYTCCWQHLYVHIVYMVHTMQPCQWNGKNVLGKKVTRQITPFFRVQHYDKSDCDKCNSGFRYLHAVPVDDIFYNNYHGRQVRIKNGISWKPASNLRKILVTQIGFLVHQSW